MRRLYAVLACACAALAFVGAASSVTVGVADDAGKYASDGGAGFFDMLTELGATENRVAVFWDPSHPTTIVDQAFLDRAIPTAARRGIEVMFAIYPLKARGLVDTPNGIQLFRRLRGAGRAALPIRSEDHLPQRGQPTSVPPAPIRRGRKRHLRIRAGAGDGGVLRRAEGGRPGHRRDRLRTLAAW